MALELRVCMAGVYERDEIPAEMHSEVLKCLEVNVESRRLLVRIDDRSVSNDNHFPNPPLFNPLPFNLPPLMHQNPPHINPLRIPIIPTK